ncbi:MAG: hypothetical protein SF187_28905 [Deltaproteobacteria bacterium]|nr:hypothetical protein [Deltaproteobacteria bacterium]
MIREIKGLPQDAAEPIAVAIELCASMPGPLRKVWGRVRSHWETLKALLGHFSWEPHTLELAIELESRLDSDRIFSVDTYERESPPGTVIVDARGEIVGERQWPWQAHARSSEVFSRSTTRGKDGRRRNFDDLLVLLAAVLREHGLLTSGTRRHRSMFEVMSDILELGWSDDARLSESRSPEALRVQLGRAARGSSLAKATSVTVKLLEAHKHQRHPPGVWVYRP